MPSATLHSLLRPVLGDLDRLPVRQRHAIRSAFGMTEQGPTDLFLVALATLQLIADAAASSGLLVTVDDLHLVDQTSKDVLSIVARRVDAEPLVLVGGIRPGHVRPAPETATNSFTQVGSRKPAAAWVR